MATNITLVQENITKLPPDGVKLSNCYFESSELNPTSSQFYANYDGTKTITLGSNGINFLIPEVIDNQFNWVIHYYVEWKPTELSEPEIPIVENGYFEGWYKDSNFTNKMIWSDDPTQNVPANKCNFYGKFTLTVSYINFEENPTLAASHIINYGTSVSSMINLFTELNSTKKQRFLELIQSQYGLTTSSLITINIFIQIGTGGIYVDHFNGNDNNTGLRTSPLKTINKALSMGAKQIYVLKGIYQELIEYNDSTDLVIESIYGPDETILLGNSSISGGEISTKGRLVTSNGHLTIIGFTIKNSAPLKPKSLKDPNLYGGGIYRAKAIGCRFINCKAIYGGVGYRSNIYSSLIDSCSRLDIYDDDGFSSEYEYTHVLSNNVKNWSRGYTMGSATDAYISPFADGRGGHVIGLHRYTESNAPQYLDFKFYGLQELVIFLEIHGIEASNPDLDSYGDHMAIFEGGHHLCLKNGNNYTNLDNLKLIYPIGGVSFNRLFTLVDGQYKINPGKLGSDYSDGFDVGYPHGHNDSCVHYIGIYRWVKPNNNRVYSGNLCANYTFDDSWWHHIFVVYYRDIKTEYPDNNKKANLIYGESGKGSNLINDTIVNTSGQVIDGNKGWFVPPPDNTNGPIKVMDCIGYNNPNSNDDKYKRDNFKQTSRIRYNLPNNTLADNNADYLNNGIPVDFNLGSRNIRSK